MQIHYSDIATLFPRTPKATLQATVEPLNRAFDRYDISTSARIGAFLAQVGYESAGFTAMVENLNYSADALRRVFRKYFPSTDLANAYARQPQKIGARVYANRMGNGNEASKEGWTFRGRGFIQLTGKNNYVDFARAMELSLRDTISYLETREGAAMSAGWFWATNSLNTLADQGRFKTLTLRINGGTHGYESRLEIYERAKRLIS